jgi:hypothetical protein
VTTFQLFRDEMVSDTLRVALGGYDDPNEETLAVPSHSTSSLICSYKRPLPSAISSSGGGSEGVDNRRFNIELRGRGKKDQPRLNEARPSAGVIFVASPWATVCDSLLPV